MTRFRLFVFSLLPVAVSLFPTCLPGQSNTNDTVMKVTLREVISLALKNNLELRMARTDSAIAREEVLHAKMARTPYLSGGINYNFIGNPVLYRDFYSNDTTVNYLDHHAGWEVIAGIPIYNGGRISNNIEQKKLVGLIQAEILKMTEAEVKLEVIRQFYNLIKLYRESEIIEANTKSIELRIRQLISRVANGQNLISDLKRTELQLSNYQIDVFRTRNNIAIIANYLCILTGIEGSPMIVPAETVLEVPADTLIYEECLSEAMNNRYELKQSQLNMQLSELSLDMSKSLRRPIVTGNALYTSQYPVPGTFPPQPDILNYWAVGLGVSYEISSLYNSGHRIKSNRLQIEKDQIQIENVRNAIDQVPLPSS